MKRATPGVSLDGQQTRDACSHRSLLRPDRLRVAAPALLALLSLGIQACHETRAEDIERTGSEGAEAEERAGLVPEWQRHREEKAGDEYPAPPPPFSYGIFPCSDCHEDMEVNYQVRQLEDEHEDIRLNHGPRERWCFDCHNPEDRDVLRLASGQTIPFTESYRLCGQCHGPKLRDWRAGVHGKRTGRWDGRKEYLLCPHCHNPHSPRFPPLAPKPPPPRPENIR